MNKYDILYNEINNIELIIPNKIDTEDLKELFNIFNTNKPIPIRYFEKNLVEKKTIKCNKCSRRSLYTDNLNNYCWIHSQSH